MAPDGTAPTDVLSATKLDSKLKHVISKYCESYNKTIVIPSADRLAAYEKEYLIFAASLGVTVISCLTKIGVFSEETLTKEKGKMNYRLILEKACCKDLLASGSLYKAPISQNKFPTAYTVKRGDKRFGRSKHRCNRHLMQYLSVIQEYGNASR